MHNEAHNLSYSPNVIRMSRQIKIRQAGHAWGRREMHAEFCGKPVRKKATVGGRIILNLIFGKYVGLAWTGFI